MGDYYNGYTKNFGVLFTDGRSTYMSVVQADNANEALAIASKTLAYSFDIVAITDTDMRVDEDRKGHGQRLRSVVPPVEPKAQINGDFTL